MIDIFGIPGGRPVLYFHGAPGAAAEAALLSTAARTAGVELWALRRTEIAPGATGAAYLDALADAVRTLGGGRSLPILGFSIGAALALRVAARLGAAAGPLRLLSPGGPLDTPGALDGAAGAAMFRMAQADGRGFRLAVAAQAPLARRAPGPLRAVLFASADPGDRALANEPAARAVLTRTLSDAFADGGAGYRRDLACYVEPWSGELASVIAPVGIWHGAADRWAPPAMGRDLADRLPNARLAERDGGHYATLIAAASAALEGLAA